MYSFPSLEPVCCSMSSTNSCFCTWIQNSQGAGQVVWYSHLSEFSTVCCHPHRGFGLVSKAEVDVFLEFCCFFDDPMDVGNLISGSSGFSKTSLDIWNFQFTCCWNLTWRVLSITFLACETSAIVQQFEHFWHCLSLGLEWKVIFSSSVATAEFSKFVFILSATLSQHQLLGFELAQVKFHHPHQLCS